MAAAALSAVVALCSACGGGSSGSSPTSPSAPSTPSPSGSACAAIGGPALGLGITNGANCSPASSPVVKLNLRDAGGDYTGFCSGTVIAARAVLTAAHCLDEDTASVKVFPGAGAQIEAVSFTVFPGYTASSALDVGVVLTAEDLPRTPVPVLQSREPQVGEQAVVAGWGLDLTGVSITVPRAGFTTVSQVGSVQVETSFSATTSGVCSGDSGGPLMVMVGGVWTIAGVTSATSQAGSCFGATSYYTKVTNAQVQAFLLAQVPDLRPR